MIIRNILLLFILMYAARSIASDCHIVSYSKIYYLEKKDVTANDLIAKSESCDDKQKLLFLKAVLDYQGTFPSSLIKEEIKNISITPERITIDSISNLLAQKLNLGDAFQLSELRTSSLKIIRATDNDQINATMQNKKLGSQSIKLITMNAITGEEVTIWVTGQLETKVSAFVSKNNSNNNISELNKSMFNLTTTYTAYPERIFSDISRISHYKLTRPIPKGHVLESSDMVAIPLVQIGVPVSVIMNQNGIHLTRKAIPTRTGRFGEVIQLKSLSNNKIITGKVLDFNKVVIEL